MSQIKQILLLKQAGRSIKGIARELGISKNTVKEYLLLFETSKLTVEEMLATRKRATVERQAQANQAYQRLKYLCRLGKFIWAQRNPARSKAYVLKIRGSGVVTTPNEILPVNSA